MSSWCVNGQLGNWHAHFPSNFMELQRHGMSKVPGKICTITYIYSWPAVNTQAQISSPNSDSPSYQRFVNVTRGGEGIIQSLAVDFSVWTLSQLICYIIFLQLLIFALHRFVCFFFSLMHQRNKQDFVSFWLNNDFVCVGLKGYYKLKHFYMS